MVPPTMIVLAVIADALRSPENPALSFAAIMIAATLGAAVLQHRAAQGSLWHSFGFQLLIWAGAFGLAAIFATFAFL